MTTKPNDTAFPCADDAFDDDYSGVTIGLTKREYFATKMHAALLVGVIGRPQSEREEMHNAIGADQPLHKLLAARAVVHADALIAALNEVVDP